ncbi:MAG: 50S ribosomal protein L21 [Actinomycetota bacterium]
MYAVIKTGGKQHKVQKGDLIEVELVEGDPGDKVTFEPILVVEDDGSTHFGKDAQKAVVTAKLVGEKKGEKVRVFKYRAKTGYSRRQGHRQTMSLLEVEDVSMKKAPAKKSPAKKAAAKSEADSD